MLEEFFMYCKILLHKFLSFLACIVLLQPLKPRVILKTCENFTKMLLIATTKGFALRSANYGKCSNFNYANVL